MVQSGRPTIQEQSDFFRAAWRIVDSEGLPGLTLERLAEEAGSSLAAVRQHFGSREALVAELQREALDVLYNSFLLGQSHLDELACRRGFDAPTQALARGVAASHFWIAAEEAFPERIRLPRRMFTDPEYWLEEEEATRVVPAALRLLETFRGLLDQAVAARAISAADNRERVVILVAATSGIMVGGALVPWGPELSRSPRLAAMLIRDLFLGWGAVPEQLAQVDEVLASLAEHGGLAPIPGGPSRT